jgi:hypothetical protein
MDSICNTTVSELLIKWLASNETAAVTHRFLHCKIGYGQLQALTNETGEADRTAKWAACPCTQPLMQLAVGDGVEVAARQTGREERA